MKTKRNVSDTLDAKRGLSHFFNALFASKEISGITSTRARAFVSGKVMRVLNKVSKCVSNTSSRFFGTLMLTFSLLSMILHFAKYYLGYINAANIPTVIICAVIVLISVPLLIFDHPIGILFQKNSITDFILFEFFAINRMTRSEKVKTIHPLFGLLIGSILAALSLFFAMESIVFIILSVLFFVISMISPEFPIMLSLVALPYVNIIPYGAMGIAIVSVLAFFSFARKVLIGKRVYSLELCDILLILFGAFVVIGCSVSGSRNSASEIAILLGAIFAYIPLTNVIVNRRLAICATNAIIVSMLPIAIYAIYRFVFDFVMGNHTVASAVFTTPEAFAAYLTVAIVLSAGFVVERGDRKKKIIYMFILAVYALALITTECVPVILVFLLLLPIYLIVKSLSFPREVAFVFAISPSAIFLLPDNILENISSFFFAMPNLVQMKKEFYDALIMFRQSVFFGIGSEQISELGYSPSVNSILWILCDFGVIAAGIFFVFFMIRLRQLSAFSIYRSSSNVSNFITIATVSVLMLISLGCFYNIFAEMSILYLFFAALAIALAAIRISKRDHDDRLGYYSDLRSTDSSVIDILVRS